MSPHQAPALTYLEGVGARVIINVVAAGVQKTVLLSRTAGLFLGVLSVTPIISVQRISFVND